MSDDGHGRIEVHTHLLPGVDDGCETVAESLQCARMLVDAGYSHAFCTPHVWPSLPGNNVGSIRRGVAELQAHLDANDVALRLHPGGEINLHAMWPAIENWPREQIVTYALAGKFVLFDFWSGRMSDCGAALHEAIAHLRSLEFQPILAHPERIMALQSDPAEIDALRDAGVLLQMNLWCLAEPHHTREYQTATRLLADEKYFMFGTDCHNPEVLSRSIEGLSIARSLVSDEVLRTMTIDNPRTLLASAPSSQPINRG